VSNETNFLGLPKTAGGNQYARLTYADANGKEIPNLLEGIAVRLVMENKEEYFKNGFLDLDSLIDLSKDPLVVKLLPILKSQKKTPYFGRKLFLVQLSVKWDPATQKPLNVPQGKFNHSLMAYYLSYNNDKIYPKELKQHLSDIESMNQTLPPEEQTNLKEEAQNWFKENGYQTPVVFINISDTELVKKIQEKIYPTFAKYPDPKISDENMFVGVLAYKLKEKENTKEGEHKGEMNYSFNADEIFIIPAKRG
jgi:hypothetical protein